MLEPETYSACELKLACEVVFSTWMVSSNLSGFV